MCGLSNTSRKTHQDCFIVLVIHKLMTYRFDLLQVARQLKHNLHVFESKYLNMHLKQLREIPGPIFYNTLILKIRNFV